jgi:hypothetical protein
MLTMSEKQEPSYDDLRENVERLLDISLFSEFTAYLERLHSNMGGTEEFRTFVESEAFGRDMMRRIGEAAGVRDIALCLDCIILTSKDAAKIILSHRGFGLSVIPAKMNEETDIEDIGLCLELLGKADPMLSYLVGRSDDLNKEKLIGKINAEKDVYKIGHAIERLWRGDQEFSKRIVESDSFDLAALAEKLKAEDDPAKVEMCLDGIAFASPVVAQNLRSAL